LVLEHKECQHVKLKKKSPIRPPVKETKLIVIPFIIDIAQTTSTRAFFKGFFKCYENVSHLTQLSNTVQISRTISH
jgi:hypothetical protein